MLSAPGTTNNFARCRTATCVRKGDPGYRPQKGAIQISKGVVFRHRSPVLCSKARGQLNQEWKNRLQLFCFLRAAQHLLGSRAWAHRPRATRGPRGVNIHNFMVCLHYTPSPPFAFPRSQLVCSALHPRPSATPP